VAASARLLPISRARSPLSPHRLLSIRRRAAQRHKFGGWRPRRIAPIATPSSPMSGKDRGLCLANDPDPVRPLYHRPGVALTCWHRPVDCDQQGCRTGRGRGGLGGGGRRGGVGGGGNRGSRSPPSSPLWEVRQGERQGIALLPGMRGGTGGSFRRPGRWSVGERGARCPSPVRASFARNAAGRSRVATIP